MQSNAEEPEEGNPCCSDILKNLFCQKLSRNASIDSVNNPAISGTQLENHKTNDGKLSDGGNNDGKLSDRGKSEDENLRKSGASSVIGCHFPRKIIGEISAGELSEMPPGWIPRNSDMPR